MLVQGSRRGWGRVFWPSRVYGEVLSDWEGAAGRASVLDLVANGGKLPGQDATPPLACSRHRRVAENAGPNPLGAKDGAVPLGGAAVPHGPLPLQMEMALPPAVARSVGDCEAPGRLTAAGGGPRAGACRTHAQVRGRLKWGGGGGGTDCGREWSLDKGSLMTEEGTAGLQCLGLFGRGSFDVMDA